MKSAVFTKNKEIIGFLEHEHRPFRNRRFSIRVPRELQPTYKTGVPQPIVATTCDIIEFEWGCVGSCRDADEGHHSAIVLIVDRTDLLGKVRGFKWFAEEFGEFIPHRRPTLG